MTIDLSVRLSPHVDTKKGSKELAFPIDAIPRSPFTDDTTDECESDLPCAVERCESQEKRVTFAPSFTSIIDTLHVKDYTKEEWQATWYTVAEAKQVQKTRHAVVQHMESLNKDWDSFDGECSDHDEMCYRGLEGKTQKARRRRYLEQGAALSAVLDEQDQQYARGILQPSEISYLYEMHTRHCMERARLRGQRDAKVAAAVVAAWDPKRKQHESKPTCWIRRIIDGAA